MKVINARIPANRSIKKSSDDFMFENWLREQQEMRRKLNNQLTTKEGGKQ